MFISSPSCHSTTSGQVMRKNLNIFRTKNQCKLIKRMGPPHRRGWFSDPEKYLYLHCSFIIPSNCEIIYSQFCFRKQTGFYLRTSFQTVVYVAVPLSGNTVVYLSFSDLAQPNFESPVLCTTITPISTLDKVFSCSRPTRTI